MTYGVCRPGCGCGAVCMVKLGNKAGQGQLGLLLEEEMKGGRPGKEELGIALADGL